MIPMLKMHVHRFKEKIGYTNSHHLRPQSRGGQTIGSNLISIDARKHLAWHLLFGNRTLEEIILFIRDYIRDDLTFFRASRNEAFKYLAWRLLFKTNTVDEIVLLLERLRQFKESQRFNGFTN